MNNKQQSQLTLSDRITIETGIADRRSFKWIADIIG